MYVLHGQVAVAEKSKGFNIKTRNIVGSPEMHMVWSVGQWYRLSFSDDKNTPQSALLFLASFKNLHYYYAIFAYITIWDAVDGFASRGSHVFASLCPPPCCFL
mmetsp:Transcript_21262/g.31735  ORF Transcript_21262/g.31735 Transcript_21262/m.31735 type:complete len:103 (+) Transcript_21262:334-642(+)